MKKKSANKVVHSFLLILIACLLAIPKTNAQKFFEDYKFIGIKEGISKRAVTCIAQDKYGYIWIGTYGAGLYKYDGINYTDFQYDRLKNNSINSNLIYAICVDTSNTLWIGTDQGISFYNRALNKFEPIVLRGSNDAVGVKSIIQDNFGNLILGTFGNGAFKLNLKTLKATTLRSDIETTYNYYINNITKDSKGVIYMATSFGLKALQPNGSSIKNVLDAQNKPLCSEAIESIVIDKNKNIWLGTFKSGLKKVSKKGANYTIQSFPITKKRVLALLNVDQNEILCATENDGLFLLDQKGTVLKNYTSNKADYYSLKSNSIWCLFSDKENRIWLGYYNKGVDVFDKLYSKFGILGTASFNDPTATETGSVTGLAKDASGKIWMSIEGGGISIYNPSTKKIIKVSSKNSSGYSGIKDDDVQTVFIDSHQNVWAGTWNEGIFFLKKGSNNFINIDANTTEGLKSNRIISFSEDSNGTIWIGTYLSGLHYYIPSQNKFYHCSSKEFDAQKLTNGDIRKVMVDSKNVIWIGTTIGVFKIICDDKFNFSVTAIKDGGMKRTQTVLSIFESKDHQIWVGTDGVGLFSYNQKKKSFNWCTDVKGLTERSVAAITQDEKGAIWISGKAGITKVDLSKKIALNYTKDDGLLDNDFNNNAVLKDAKGQLYFGSYEGVNCFNPEKIVKNTKEPLLYFTDLKLFNKSVNIYQEGSPLSKVISETDTLVLNHNQSVFTLDFIGLNYSHPVKNEYAYYLEGFEKDWNYVGGKRTATYTNLPSGTYVFMVKSANRGGVWSKEPLKLYIEVLPPYWRTGFAYFLYFSIFVVIFIYMNKFLQKRFEEKQAIEFERNKANQIEKLNAKKLQFFTNISHEFRTPLTLIINPLEDIIRNKSFGLPNEVLNKLHVIHKSSDRLSRLINELMDFNKLQFNKMTLRVQQVEVVSFTRNIVGYFEEEAASRSIDLQFETTVESLQDWLDPKMFEKIIFNIISNAFKVTADNGKIKVRINATQKMIFLPLASELNKVETFEIAIEDTGAGLNKKDIKRIFDRFYQVNNLNKTYYGSTGIGLEVVRGFVELHKGKIEVDSTLGVGTTFTIVFPLGNEFFSEAEIVDEEHQVVLSESIKRIGIDEDEVTNAETAGNEITHTILIVEDNTELRNYLKDELKKTYKVLVAENGFKGVELAKQKLPDLILTDVIMPVMNGLELCKKVKADLKTSHIPLLMLSAKALVQDKLEGIDSGADMYMSKPFDMDVLKSSLGQLINSRQIMFDKFYKGITKNAKEKTTTLDNDFIQKTLNFIHENINESDLSVEVLASKVFLSRSQLYRKIKTLTGVSVNEFIRNVRLEKAREMIQLGNSNINEISYKVGFASPSYFTKCYKAKYGHLPTQQDKDATDLE